MKYAIMIFRPVRGLLSESLNDKQEIQTLNDLHKIIDRNYLVQPLDINFKPIGYDDRIGCNCWHVCAKMVENGQYGVVGYLHDDPKKLL